jgi:hypothetical protein
MMQDCETVRAKAPTSVPEQPRKQPPQTHGTSEIPKNVSKQFREQAQPPNGPSVKKSEDADGLHDRNLKTSQWVTMFTPVNTPTTNPAIPVVAFDADIPEIELDALIYRQPEAVDDAKHIKALDFPYSRASLGLWYGHVGGTDQGEPGDSDPELLAVLEGLAWASPQGHGLSGVDLGVAQEL